MYDLLLCFGCGQATNAQPPTTTTVRPIINTNINPAADNDIEKYRDIDENANTHINGTVEKYHVFFIIFPPEKRGGGKASGNINPYKNCGYLGEGGTVNHRGV